MTKILLSYLAGVLTISGVVVYADGRAAVMFAAGLTVPILAAVAWLASVARIRSTARWLARFAEFFGGGLHRHNRRSQTSAELAASGEGRDRKPAPQLVDQRVIDIETGLKQLGTSKKYARVAAEQAVKAGGNFDEMLRRAIAIARVYA